MNKDQYTLEETPNLIRLNDAWNNVLLRLAGEVQPAWYARFFKPLRPVSLSEEGHIILSAPGRFVGEWVWDRYGSRLTSMLGDELGQSVTLKVDFDPNPRKRSTTEKPLIAEVQYPSATAVVVHNEPKEIARNFKPNPDYTFDSFVVGQNNRLAQAGAMGVASLTAAKYNPFFMYSEPGLGKTHLMHAIANEVLKKDPRFPVIYSTAQEFAEEYVAALQNHRIDQFRRQQKSIGLWLIDDIQFIAGKDKTQEEIFYTFNHLYNLGKQIVICSDRSPRDLFLMEERLRSRFEAGLVADIQFPDTETRCAILLQKAAQKEISLGRSEALVLAERVVGNVRLLDGTISKLHVYASLNNSPINEELVNQFVAQYFNDVPSKVDLDHIVQVVGRHFKIATDDIMGTSRKAPIVQARHVSIYLLRELTGDSWKYIGTQFGDRDHTSMMHAYERIVEQMHQEPDFKQTVKSLKRTIRR